MRIVFFGTPSLSVEALRAVIESGKHEVVLCVTQPDRPAGRKLKMQSPAVKQFCDDAGIDCIQPDGFRKKSDRLAIEGYDPDLLMTAAYGRIIPSRIFEIGRWKAINLHPSLLPKYRGASPIRWALISGEETTGVSIIRVEKELDAGDVLLRREVEIAPRETWGDLSVRLFRLGGEMLVETAELLKSGKAAPTPQNHDAATYVGKIGIEERALDFNCPARETLFRVRAMLPQPPAFFQLKGKKVFVTGLPEIRVDEGSPGEILNVSKEGIVVACSKKSILFTRLKAEGRGDLAGADFANGHRLKAGDVFDNG